MTPNEERMAVNAAIEKLIAKADEDGEAARVVVSYGSKLKASEKIQIESVTNQKSSGGEVSGYSPQHGEITVKDEKREERKEWTRGVYKDRIGHYRLWKEDDGLLKFHHFWKSGLTTKSPDSEDPETYHLGYDIATLEPKYLGIRRKRITAKFWLLCTVEIARPYLEPVYGDVPKLDGIGFILHG